MNIKIYLKIKKIFYPKIINYFFFKVFNLKRHCQKKKKKNWGLFLVGGLKIYWVEGYYNISRVKDQL